MRRTARAAGQVGLERLQLARAQGPRLVQIERLFRMQLGDVHATPRSSSSNRAARRGSDLVRALICSRARRMRLRTVLTGTPVACATSGSVQPRTTRMARLS